MAHKGSRAIHIGFRAVGGVTQVVFNELVPSVGDSTLRASATFLRNQGKGWSWAAEVLDGTNLVLARLSKAGTQIILVPVLTGIVLTNEVACAIDGLAKGVQKDFKKAGKNFVATLKKNEKASSNQNSSTDDERNERGR